MSGPWEKYAAQSAPAAEQGPWTRYQRPAAAPEPSYDPTEGMSTFEKAAAGFGKSLWDTWNGIRQVTGNLSQQEVDEIAKRDAPLMKTGAGLAGNIGGQVAQMAVGSGVPAVVAAKYAPGAISAVTALAPKTMPFINAAAQSGAFTALQPVQTGESRLGNVALSAAAGAAGQGVASGAARLARGASDTMAPNIRALYERAIELGIPVRVEQLGDSKFIKTLASQLERLPGTGAAAARDRQQIAFNNAVSRQFGENADRITPEVYAAAKQRLGGMFEDLSSRNNLQLNDELVGRIAALVDESNRYATQDTGRAIGNLAEDVLRRVEAGNLVPGRAYQSIDSNMGQLMRAGGEKAHYIGQLRDMLREGMDQSISQADRQAWDAARGQYKALKTVRDLVAKSPSGDISPALLQGRVTANNAGKEAMASGRAGDLGDIAAIGRQFVRDPVPDSGTSQRLLASALLPAAGGVAGYAGSGEGGGMTGLLGGALLGVTAGRGVNAALNSPAMARYVAEGAPAGIRALFAPAQVAPYALPALVNATR